MKKEQMSTSDTSGSDLVAMSMLLRIGNKQNLLYLGRYLCASLVNSESFIDLTHARLNRRRKEHS